MARYNFFLYLTVCYIAFAFSAQALPLTPVAEFRDGAQEEALPGDIDHLRKLAEEGSAQAQFHLGMIYSKGQEVEKNVFEAVSYLRQAAEQGHLEAQYQLGLLYGHGNSVEDARQWIRRAALNGHRGAQLELGRMMAAGNGAEPDYVEAYKWWLIAARHGDQTADRNRERLESLMSEEQIRQAVSLAVAFESPAQKGQ